LKEFKNHESLLDLAALALDEAVLQPLLTPLALPCLARSADSSCSRLA